MLRKSAVAAAIVMLIALPALAQNPPAAPPVRVRGTIAKVDGANLTVKARDGMDVKVAVTDATRIQSLVKKSLAEIKAGDFLASTGVKGTDGKLHAIEVRIFPEAQPDGGRQFAWDLGSDSVMTNATVGTVKSKLSRVLPGGNRASARWRSSRRRLRSAISCSANAARKRPAGQPSLSA